MPFFSPWSGGYICLQPLQRFWGCFVRGWEGHELGFASTLLQDPEGCSGNSLSYPDSGFALDFHH